MKNFKIYLVADLKTAIALDERRHKLIFKFIATKWRAIKKQYDAVANAKNNHNKLVFDSELPVYRFNYFEWIKVLKEIGVRANGIKVCAGDTTRGICFLMPETVELKKKQ